MRVRTKSALFRRYRTVGITFTREWQEVDPAKLSPEKLAHLTGPENEPFLEIEGAPAPKVAPSPPAARPGQPASSAAPLPGGDEDDEDEDDLLSVSAKRPTPPVSPSPPLRPPPKGK